jgi:hypothetical protein
MVETYYYFGATNRYIVCPRRNYLKIENKYCNFGWNIVFQNMSYQVHGRKHAELFALEQNIFHFLSSLI